jgi:lycopene cyclase domain-containing protein
MTYWLLNAVFLAAAATVALAALVRHRGSGRTRGAPTAGIRNAPTATIRDGRPADDAGRKPRPTGAHRPRKAGAAVVLTLLALCVLTAVFDNIMIAAGLFEYSAEHTSGWRIGLAPLEDFAYVLAAALLLPALWTLLPAGRQTAGRKDAHGE